MVLLGEMLYNCGESLDLSLEGSCGGSSSRMSLVVAIERVSTMQLFRPGSNNTAYELQRIVSFPIDDAN